MSFWKRIKNLWTISGITDIRYLREEIAERVRQKPATIVDTRNVLDNVDLT